MDYEQIVAAMTGTIEHSYEIRASPEMAARSALLTVGRIVAPDFRQIAQMVHSAFHHADDSITWRECPVASCVRARDAIAALGVEP